MSDGVFSCAPLRLLCAPCGNKLLTFLAGDNPGTNQRRAGAWRWYIRSVP